MALYHLSAKTFSRSRGQTAIAAAAYRTGTKLYNFLTGETYDYRRKGGVLATFKSLPKRAPSWAKNTQALWNKVEQSEKRKNSTVAREIEVSLPCELEQHEQIQLTKRLASELTKRHSVAVEASIHKPHKNNDERNIHAHLLLSTRRIDENGFHEKSREFDGGKTGSETIEFWRKRWAEITNEALQKKNLSVKVDHRSYKRRGLNIEPTQHKGPFVTQMERQGYRTRIGSKNSMIEKRNRCIMEKSRSFKKTRQNISTQLKP